jgi:7,8-dihydroneopterin aldolase/epimerase/oxygenase
VTGSMQRTDGPAGRIEIRGVRALGHHGVEEVERDRAQPFEVDVDLDLDDVAKAVASDDLSVTVDYREVVEWVVDTVATARFRLLEGLTDAIALGVLDRFGGSAVTVTVRKLRPPLAADVTTVGVQVRRSAASSPSPSE